MYYCVDRGVSSRGIWSICPLKTKSEERAYAPYKYPDEILNSMFLPLMKKALMGSKLVSFKL